MIVGKFGKFGKLLLTLDFQGLQSKTIVMTWLNTHWYRFNIHIYKVYTNCWYLLSKLLTCWVQEAARYANAVLGIVKEHDMIL